MAKRHYFTPVFSGESPPLWKQHSVHSTMDRVPAPETLLASSRQRTKQLFGEIHISSIEANQDIPHRARLASKIRSDYKYSQELPAFLAQKHGKAKKPVTAATTEEQTNGVKQIKMIEDAQYVSMTREDANYDSRNQPSNALTVRTGTTQGNGAGVGATGSTPRGASSSLIRRENYQPVKPEWHAPWKLRTVLRCVFMSFQKMY